MAEKISPQGYVYGLDPKSNHAFWDTGTGESSVIEVTATATVDETTGTPSVTVTQSGDNNQSINFAFSGLKGEQGEQGPQGPQGEQGETGPTGATGATGKTPTITATATVDDTSGEPTVLVTDSTISDERHNFAFSFTGLKGTKGDTGATGATGEQGPQGEAGTNGISPTVTATGSTESGALAGTVTGADGTVVNIYNGAQGEAGSGTTVDTNGLVKNITITNENGVYTVSQTKVDSTATGGEATSEAGTISIPEQANVDNLIAEVNDSIVENDTNNYDFHTITETENNGTKNSVGSFYIARKQITALEMSSDNSAINYKTVNQSGTEETGALALPTSSGGSYTEWKMALSSETVTGLSLSSSDAILVYLSVTITIKASGGSATLTRTIYVLMDANARNGESTYKSSLANFLWFVYLNGAYYPVSIEVEQGNQSTRENPSVQVDLYYEKIDDSATYDLSTVFTGYAGL